LFESVNGNYQTMLDIGAGQGEMADYFRERGYDVSIWDVSPSAVERMRQRGYEAHLVDLESAEPQGSFDLVCCCEVLQQLHRPYHALRKMARLVRPGGRLFLSTPNEFHLMRRLGYGEPVESHISLFSPERAQWLVEVANLEIEIVVYQPLAPPRWGKLPAAVGRFLAQGAPSLFSLSTLMLLKVADED
jgi:SAM-dependent methyltransferase